MRLTRWTVVGALWLLCVGAVAAAAWYAIDSAGQQVQVISSDAVRSGGGVPGPLTTAQATTSAPATTSTPATTSPTALGPPTATSADVGTDDGTAGGPAQDDPTRTPPATGTSPPSWTTSPPWTATTSPRTGRDAATSSTVFTRGGSVSVTCRPDEPMDYNVKPAQGWGARADRQGPQEATIVFARSADEIDVHLSCLDGRPRTTVDVHDDE